MKNTIHKVTLTLSGSDRDLILAHGYPFPGLQAAIAAVPRSVDEAVVTCDAFEVEQLLGDLARSINDCTDGGLQELLDELYEFIEFETRL